MVFGDSPIIYLKTYQITNMFEKLNGQFAVAIWDKIHKRLILARDRFSEKPLFYFHKDNNFCFASEAKAILKDGFVHAAISPIALKQVFTYWTTLNDRSIFLDTYQIPLFNSKVVEKLHLQQL